MIGSMQPQTLPGQGETPEEIKRRMMIKALMSSGGGGGGEKSSGPAQLGQALITAFLMNPELGQSLMSGAKNMWNGAENMAQGYQWNGMAGPSMLEGLNQQAASNIKYGGPM